MNCGLGHLDLCGLGREAKVRIERGDRELDKAEQLYISAGLILIEAKERFMIESPRMGWDDWMQRATDRSARTCQEYMQIARGEKTMEEIRKAKRESVAKSREKEAALRSAVPAKVEQKQKPTKIKPPGRPGDKEKFALITDIGKLLRKQTLYNLKLIKEQIENDYA